MAVHSVTDIVPDAPARPSLHAVPIAAPAVETRMRLFDRLVTVGCELVALGMDAGRSLVASRTPDAEADAHVETIDRIAQRLAHEAAALGDERTFKYAQLIRRHCDGYRRADSAEDGLIAAAGATIGRIVAMVRGLNKALEHQIMKRGRPARTGARP